MLSMCMNILFLFLFLKNGVWVPFPLEIRTYTHSCIPPPLLTGSSSLYSLVNTWCPDLPCHNLCLPNQGDLYSSGDLELFRADLNKWCADGKGTQKVDKLQLLQVVFMFLLNYFLLLLFWGEQQAPVSAAPLMPVPSLVPALLVQQSGDTQ